MDTIDTGKNRSAADVLTLEGFKYGKTLSTLCKSILLKKLNDAAAHNTQVSNSDILKLAQEQEAYLQEIIRVAGTISYLQVIKVMPLSAIAFYLYTYGNTAPTIDFLKMITGTGRVPKTATDYVYKKLVASKTGEYRLTAGDRQLYIDKAYIKFNQGNPVVRGIVISKPVTSK